MCFFFSTDDITFLFSYLIVHRTFELEHPVYVKVIRFEAMATEASGFCVFPRIGAATTAAIAAAVAVVVAVVAAAAVAPATAAAAAG